jgi:hypothetical protein
MKIPILLTIVILAIAAMLGWRNHRELGQSRETQTRLLAEARALGLDPEAAARTDGAAAASRRPRESAGDRAAIARDFARRLALFAREIKEIEKSGEPPPEDFQQRIFELIEEMLGLDAAQVKVLVAELRVHPELDQEMRVNIIGFAIISLADKQPRAALSLIAEAQDLLKGKDHVVTATLERWARTEPLAALEWIRDHPATFTPESAEQAKLAVIGGTARQDPKLAFQLIRETGIQNLDEAGRKIADAASTPADRDAVLAAMRAMPEPESTEGGSLAGAVIRRLTSKALADGFAEASSWIEKSSLSETETSAAVSEISSHSGKDTGRWIDWMAEKLPASAVDQKVGPMMERWTREDYQAAGTWLAASPAGPARHAAVRSYAKTVAPYEPATAAQWALTLPAGPPRDDLLRHIHDQWKHSDEAAAAAFARQQNIDP